MQGEESDNSQAIGKAEIDAAELDEPHRKMLEFVELLTRSAYKTTDSDVEQLRIAGWDDQQIAEMVYIAALFALFNRVADAFGLADPKYGEMPGP